MRRALGLSAAAHVLVAAGLLAYDPAPAEIEPAMVVELVALPPPVEEAAPPTQPATQPLVRPAAPSVAKAASAPRSRPEALAPMPMPAEAPAQVGEAAPAPLAASEAPSPPPAEEEAYVPPSSHAEYLSNPLPRYPSVASKRGWKGVVILEVEVDERGSPVSVRVESSSGYSILDEAALSTVTRWRFVPARRGDRPVAAAVKVPVRFNLAEG